MNGKFILDTNIIIGLLSSELKIINNIKGHTDISIPIFVLGELFYGAYKSHNIIGNLGNIQKLLTVIPVIHINEETSRIYGFIKNSLKTKGKPIPENDIWIAALASQYDLTLITRDRHFDNIDTINIEVW